MTDSPAIEARSLKVHFQTAAGLVRAVDGVDLTVARGAFHGRGPTAGALPVPCNSSSRIRWGR